MVTQPGRFGSGRVASVWINSVRFKLSRAEPVQVGFGLDWVGSCRSGSGRVWSDWVESARVGSNRLESVESVGSSFVLEPIFPGKIVFFFSHSCDS